MKFERPSFTQVCLLAIFFLLSGCVFTEELSIELDYGGHDQSSVASNVLLIYEGESCSLVQEAMSALFFLDTHRGTREHVQYFGDSGYEVGTLPEAEYAVIALGLDADCFVTYAGCQSIGPGDSGAIVLDMEATSSTSSVCGMVSVCEEGVCTGF